MRRKLLAVLVVAAALLTIAPGSARAQSYPDRPVKMLIAFSPAGAIDILGRLIAEKLSQKWGQQVVVENRPGGGGNIGAAAAATAPADGYTLHFGAQTLGTNVTLSPTTAFHPVTSFEPIMLVGTALEIFMVANQTPFHSVKDVVDYAKANPGTLNYASVGIGTSAHLASVLFMDVTSITMQHIPYAQMSQTYTDIFSGRTQVWFTTAGGSLPHVRSGKVRGLAVNGPARSKLLPELPTMIELGINMKDESSWYGFFAPKGTPKPIIDKINRDLQTVIDMPDMR
ncbi:MAG: tripartite tricarboxylate transporter substrate-binding protein, partial [Xanthobacteraceae bacterium]